MLSDQALQGQTLVDGNPAPAAHGRAGAAASGHKKRANAQLHELQVCLIYHQKD
jgi:hypothetical protein